MTLRQPCVAADWGGFYPASPDRCRRLLEQCTGSALRASPRGPVAGGIVPHAGWVFSGKVAATTLLNLNRDDVETVVLFGAVHVPGVRTAAVWPTGAWATPLGEVSIDEELARAVSGDQIVADEQAHEGEHAIEVELPFLREILPGARLLPISVPPDERAAGVGLHVARQARALGRRAIALGSTDLTHYGERFGFAPHGTGRAAHAWVKETNDRGMLDAMERLDSAAAIDEARRNKNACGAGAVSATLAFAREAGATRGQLLQHTSSFEVRPETGGESFVCYASLLFCR